MITKTDYQSHPIAYTVVDVRTAEERQKAYIPGSLHIPLAELLERQIEIPRHQVIAVVCGSGGGRSIEGAELLRSLGLNADWLEGGTHENLD